jgi:hypothetical protein
VTLPPSPAGQPHGSPSSICCGSDPCCCRPAAARAWPPAAAPLPFRGVMPDDARAAATPYVDGERER